MLSTRVCTLPGRTAAHAWRTAFFSSATVEEGHPCLGSRLTFDPPKHAQLGSFLDSELASPWSQHPVGPKRLPCHGAVWGRALSWTYTKLCPNTPIARGNIWFLRIWMYRCRLMAPFTTTSSLLPPWWIASHTMTDRPRFPSLGWTQASISPSPCLRRTWTRPSLKNRENRDSSLKIQCLHCLRSHTLCLLPHSRQRRLCSKLNLAQRNIHSLYRNPTLHKSIKVLMARQTWLQVTTPELTFFPSLESQRSPDNTDCVWPLNLVS